MNRCRLTWATFLLVGAIIGCATRTVEFRTTPSMATVSVSYESPSGTQTVVLPSDTPVRHTLDFGRAKRFNAVFEKKDYQTKTLPLTVEYVESLPKENNVYILRETLKEEEFRETEAAEVVVDAHAGLQIKIRTVRAYKEDIERDGVPASSILSLGDNQWIGGLAASPVDDRIAFSVVERVKDRSGKEFQFSTIRSVNGAGGGIVQLTKGQRVDTDPSYSFNGKHLYFASNRNRPRYLDLFRIISEEAGGGIASIYSGEGWSRAPSTPADGFLAFSFTPEYFGKPSTTHVWTLGGVNKFPTQLMEGSDPELSPDGQQIAYVGPDNKLWKLVIGTNTQIQLTTNPATCESDPTWSRDGKYILFVSNEGRDNTGVANNDIWVIRADGTDKRQLTTNGSDDSKVVVGHGQKWIYFVSNRGYKWGIWRIPWPTDLDQLP